MFVFLMISIYKKEMIHHAFAIPLHVVKYITTSHVINATTIMKNGSVLLYNIGHY